MTPRPCRPCLEEASRRHPALARADAGRMFATVTGAGGLYLHLYDRDARRLCTHPTNRT